MLRIATTFAAILTLAACGGSKTGNSPPVQKAPPTEFEALAADVAAADFRLGWSRPTGFDELPTAGGASFDGVAIYREVGSVAPTVVWEGDDPDMISRMAMDVNFANLRVTGGADRFHEVASGRRLQGKLDLTGAIQNDHGTAVMRGVVAGDMAQPRGRDNAGGTFNGQFTGGIDRARGGMAIQTPTGQWESLWVADRDR